MRSIAIHTSHRQLPQFRSFVSLEGGLPGTFWALACATLLFNIGASTYLFLYNLFMLGQGFQVRPLGLFAGAMALGSAVGTIPLASLSRRFGVRTILFACLLISGTAFAARVFFVVFPAQLAFAFLDGVTLAGWVVCLAPAVAGSAEPAKRPLAFSIVFAIAVGSSSLGGLIGGHLPDLLRSAAAISVANSQRITLALAGAMIALAAWPVWCLRRECRREQPGWLMHPTPSLLRFLAANALWGAALGAFNPFANVYFSRYLGVPASHLGSFFSVAQLVQAAAVLTVPLLLRRTGLTPGIMLMQLAAAIAMGALACAHGVLGAEVNFCGLMAAQHMCEPAIQSVLMGRVSEGDRSAATAMLYLSVSVAQAATAAIAGTAFLRFSYPHVLTGIAVCMAVAAIAFRSLILAPRVRQVEAEVAQVS